MHGVAQSAGETVGAAEKFSHEAVQQVIQCQIADIAALVVLFNNAQQIAAEETFHDLHEFFFGQVADGVETFGKHFTVTAV